MLSYLFNFMCEGYVLICVGLLKLMFINCLFGFLNYIMVWIFLFQFIIDCLVYLFFLNFFNVYMKFNMLKVLDERMNLVYVNG